MVTGRGNVACMLKDKRHFTHGPHKFCPDTVAEPDLQPIQQDALPPDFPARVLVN